MKMTQTANNATETTETTTETTEKAKRQPVVFENWEKVKPNTLKAIEDLISAVKAKTKTNVIAAVKNLEEYANSSKGETNLKKRIAWLAAGLDIHPSEIVESKAGVTALATMLGNLYSGNPAGENVNVQKKEKESPISVSEMMLGDSFAIAQVSDTLRSLTEQDVNAVQSATHAAFQTSLKLLSTKENPFPRGAMDWLSCLIAASGGSLDWFECSDEFLAESAGISLSTIKRGRAKLIEWMQASGKGIVSINQPAKKPTQYKVNLMAATSAIIHNLLVSDHANPENLLVVAGLTGKLLTDGTDKIRTEVSDETLAAARDMTASLNDAIGILPKPQVKYREAAKASSEEHTKKRFETFNENLGNALEKANEAGLEKVQKALEKLAKEVKATFQKWEADTKTEIDWTTLDNNLSAQLITIKEHATTEAEKAKAAVEAEKEAGEVSPETRRYLAESHIAQYQTPEAISQEQEECIEAYTFNVFALAAIGDSFEDFDRKKALYLQLQDTLQAAFKFGAYAKPDASE